MRPADRRDNEARKRAVDRMADRVSKELLRTDFAFCFDRLEREVFVEQMRLVAHKAVDQDRRWRARRTR
jgi:hypothetical protein